MADKLQMLEEEVKLLKNEIKQVLLDIKEHMDIGPVPLIQPALKRAPAAPAEEKVIVKTEMVTRKEEPVNNVSEPGGNGKESGENLATLNNMVLAAIKIRALSITMGLTSLSLPPRTEPYLQSPAPTCSPCPCYPSGWLVG